MIRSPARAALSQNRSFNRSNAIDYLMVDDAAETRRTPLPWQVSAPSYRVAFCESICEQLARQAYYGFRHSIPDLDDGGARCYTSRDRCFVGVPAIDRR